MAIPYLACMALAASVYGLPPRVLPAIQAVEGGRLGLARPNTNGTEDLGPMQINTVWIGPLARYTGLPPQAVRHRLLHEPCFNIGAAGLILRHHLDETRGDVMRAVGNYHSRTPVRSLGYQAKVLAAARTMFAPRR